MPKLENEKEERFCNLIVYKGMTAVDAHETAGFSRNFGNASTMKKKHAERIKELNREKISGKVSLNLIDGKKVDEKWILKELKEILSEAKASNSHRVALTVVQEIAAFTGLGENNKNKVGQGKDVSKPNSKKQINIQILNNSLEKARGELTASAEKIIDITPERETVVEDSK